MSEKKTEKYWTITYGDRKIPVRSPDLAEAMQTCMSLIEKELAFNEVVKGSDRTRQKFEIDQKIVEKLKQRFLEMAEAEEKRALTMKIPGRKN